MNLNRPRAILVMIFLAGVVISLASVFVTYAKAVIASGDVVSLLLKMLEIYAIPFAIILGGIFARPSAPEPTPEESQRTSAFWVAACLAALWNCLILSRCLLFLHASFEPQSGDNVQMFNSYLDEISKGSSFLVAGALSYFFAKP
jgi:hypothetical protein